MKKGLLWLVIIASILGAAVSLVATHQYFQILQSGFEEKSFCNITEFINCDLAYASSYASFGGIPISWIGFIFYLWTGILALLTLYRRESKEAVASFGWVLSLIAVAVSLYKAYIATFVLKVLCILCLSMYALNFAVFLAWHLLLRGRFRMREHRTLRPKFLQFTVLTAVLFALGWATMTQYQKQFVKSGRLNIAIDEVLPFHFRQSQYQFTPQTDRPVWGNPNAAVTIVEFSDFECPFCKEAAFRIKPMLAELKEKVRFYFYNYPLNKECNEHAPVAFHQHACVAARAAVCASQMGDFWDYHDDIFRNQKKLSRKLLIDLAKKRGWDPRQFEACLDAPETLALVRSDTDAGSKIFIEGTPTVLVNNRRVKYWNEPELLRAIVREEIRRSKPKGR